MDEQVFEVNGVCVGSRTLTSCIRQGGSCCTYLVLSIGHLAVAIVDTISRLGWFSKSSLHPASVHFQLLVTVDE